MDIKSAISDKYSCRNPRNTPTRFFVCFGGGGYCINLEDNSLKFPHFC